MVKPLISCLCVTYNRPEFLRNSVECFRAQSYPNKELIIVNNEGDSATQAFVKSIDDENIKYVSAPGLSLGQLRNLSIERSNGEYFCQWDDDDWFHRDRLAVQLAEALRFGKLGSILAYVLMYNKVEGKAYLSQPSMWPATILCKKSIFDSGSHYPDVARGEDTAFITQLFQRNILYPVANPSLYIYVYHGNNTWDADHFNRRFANSQKLPVAFDAMLAKIIYGQHSCNEASELLIDPQLSREYNYFKYVLDDINSRNV